MAIGVSSLKPHEWEGNESQSEEKHLLGSSENNPKMNSTNKGNLTGSSSNRDIAQGPA